MSHTLKYHLRATSLFISLIPLFNSCSLQRYNTCAPPIISTDSDPDIGNIQDITAPTFRILQPQTDCHFTEEQYQTVIEDWVQERGNDAPPLNGFFLGRAMDYPWISQHLAQSALRSPEWDLQAGTAKTGDPSRLVESFLLNNEFKQRLEKPFQHQSYSIGTVSIEKLAVAPINKIVPASENPRQIVPLDALLYFKLVAAP